MSSRFLEGLSLQPEDGTTWLHRLITAIVNINDDYRRGIREELCTASRRAHELNVTVALRQDFAGIVHIANGLRRDLSEVK